ncbi:MAG: bifunctional oligoribonuclease/PAP phosphatase NrnA [Candidatus Omnitrophica bacterium]|nr:bifunctional oligoribonuclease/PAP phosphatase NrnA [Candidatus Omnitrophota bacterium]
MSQNKICECLKKYNNFLITVHTSPEGDALGSELGFYYLIKKMGKKGVIINEDKLPYGYDFLPGNKFIRLLNKSSKNTEFDCLVVLDCADLKRTGDVYRLNKDKKPVLNIDHHISNRNFGDINWVDPNASSCSEMIYKLFKTLRQPIDYDAALVLYTGIMTDTGSFHYSNTSSFTFKAASELLKIGINPAWVYRNAYENMPISDMKLLVKLLPSIKFYCQGKVASFRISMELMKNKKPVIDLADQLLSFGRAIKGVEVVALFKENSSDKFEVRVNLRSQGKVDVNKIASFFGGGGHKSAAGCTVNGKIQGIEKKVIAKIKESLIDYK